MTPKSRRLSAAAAIATAIAIPAEGLRQYAYYDPPGILTACRGHTGPDVKVGVKYSLKQCDAWLTEDMREAVEIVDKCAPGLPEPVLAAFADAVYNMGPKIACDKWNSKAAAYLSAGNLAAACAQLPRWSKARVAGVLVELPGLVKRRSAEYDLCMEGA